MTTSLKIKMTGRQIKKPGTPVIGVPGSGVFLYGLLAEPTGRGSANNEYVKQYKAVVNSSFHFVSSFPAQRLFALFQNMLVCFAKLVKVLNVRLLATIVSFAFCPARKISGLAVSAKYFKAACWLLNTFFAARVNGSICVRTS